jgi:hypothetical protein
MWDEHRYGGYDYGLARDWYDDHDDPPYGHQRRKRHDPKPAPTKVRTAKKRAAKQTKASRRTNRK